MKPLSGVKILEPVTCECTNKARSIEFFKHTCALFFLQPLNVEEDNAYYDYQSSNTPNGFHQQLLLRGLKARGGVRASVFDARAVGGAGDVDAVVVSPVIYDEEGKAFPRLAIV